MITNCMISEGSCDGQQFRINSLKGVQTMWVGSVLYIFRCHWIRWRLVISECGLPIPRRHCVWVFILHGFLIGCCWVFGFNGRVLHVTHVWSLLFWGITLIWDFGYARFLIGNVLDLGNQNLARPLNCPRFFVSSLGTCHVS